ncbi:MAG TPA: metallophosphoesterase [Candidatus Dormibacteraeota bacterium]|jgi:DNA repair exonuclease SbcCD nuclease subunit|nr:metallophosphoesterase [Candidatus Dormibacteraeota bacterium]
MSFRLLHLSDLHLDRAFAGVGCFGEVARRRREGLRDALRRAGEAARQTGCDAVTIGGDLYEHEHAGLDTGRFLADTFASWQPMRVFLAPGNHDPLLPGSLYERTRWPANVHLFSGTTLEPVALADGLHLWGLAHHDPAWSGDPLEGAPVGPGVHLALFHGAELGGRPPGKSLHGPFQAERIAQRGFAAALCGHYHRRRVDPVARLLYPGSPEPLTFDEEGGRGPVVVEVTERGHVEYQPLALNRWTAVQHDCDLEGSGSSGEAVERARACAREALGGLPPERSMLRLTLRGEVSPDLALDLPLVEAAVADATGVATVRLRDLTTPAIDVEAAASDRTARGAFTRTLLAAIDREDDPGERALLGETLRYGLQALAGAEVGLR